MAFVGDFRWNESTRCRMLSAFHDESKTSHGSSCIFTAITSRVGAKLYVNRGKRDFAHRHQLKAYSYKIAPQVGSCFFIDIASPQYHKDDAEYINGVEYRRYWGYLTQIAKVRKAGVKELDILRGKLQEINMDAHDVVHHGNSGYINDRLVCIDFDPISIEL